MRICIFEDEFYKGLLPLSYLRPVYDLRCGQLTLREKIARAYPDDIFILHARDYLRDTVKEKHPGSYVNEIPAGTDRLLLVNGRMIFNADTAHMLADTGKDLVYTNEGVVAGAWLSGKNLETYRRTIGKCLVSANDFQGLRRVEAEGVDLVRYPWELVHRNVSQLELDFRLSTGGQREVLGKIYDGAHLLNPAQIHIGMGARVKPGAVLDAEKGPVYVARDVEIMPNAYIRGPVFIGEASIIKAGAKIYEGTSIGEGCKVGGEVESSTFYAHSNKQHEGYVGHSYIGEWVNIGADSNTSNLKNDYGSIRVYNDGMMVDSGFQFVGLTMGDHSKCGINSMFNTGTVVDIFCNLYGCGMPPKHVASFSWGDPSEGLVTYRIEKAIEVARKVMERRKIALSMAEEELVKRVFEMTNQDRDVTGIRK